MIIYIVVCFVLFITSLISLFFHCKNKKISNLVFLAVPFLVLYFLSIFKSVNVGRDTIAYYDFYKSLETTPWSNIFSTRFEIGYSLLNKIFVSFHAPFWLFSSFAYLIVYIPLFFVLYKRCDFPHVAIMFSISFFLAFLLSGLRQSMSISLALLALHFFAKKKPIFYVIFAFLLIASISIHKSSLVVVLIVPLSFIKFKFRYFLVLFPLLLIMFFLSDRLFELVYYSFSGGSYLPASYGNGLTFFAYLLMFSYVVLMYYSSALPASISKCFTRIDSKNIRFLSYFNADSKNDNQYFNLLMWGSVLFVFFMSFMRGNLVFPRLAWFFLPYLNISITNSISRIKSKSGELALIILMSLFYVVYFYVFTLRANALDVLPYETFF